MALLRRCVPLALAPLRAAPRRALSAAAATATAQRPHIVPEAEEKKLRGGEPLLFTPGPLTTSRAVKDAMSVDLGSRDTRMLEIIAGVRHKLLAMAGVSEERGYDCVIVQGSGTFAVESTITSVVPPPGLGGRLLVLSNGAYGERIASMANRSGIAHDIIRVGESEAFTAEGVRSAIRSAIIESSSSGAGGRGMTVPYYTHVAIIHHETTAGVLNPIGEIGKVIRETLPGASFIVDSMSAFGAYDANMERDNIDYIVASANKNIEGVPGFSFSICKSSLLERDGVHARSVSLDLLGQLEGLRNNGQFRFTPPTHALLAFDAALGEHEAEGGARGRLARYESNCEVLVDGMAEMGFIPYVDAAVRGSVITTFAFPDDPNFDFGKFYTGLAERGMVIYPGKLTDLDCFRIGSIGRLYESDMADLVGAVREVLEGMSVQLPVTQLEEGGSECFGT